jgi:hypothetical protein
VPPTSALVLECPARYTRCPMDWRTGPMIRIDGWWMIVAPLLLAVGGCPSSFVSSPDASKPDVGGPNFGTERNFEWMRVRYGTKIVGIGTWQVPSTVSHLIVLTQKSCTW